MSLKQIVIAIDQLVNALFGTMPDETISAMAHRRGWKRLERLINWLFRDDMHCAKSYIAEMNGTQNAPIYRKE